MTPSRGRVIQSKLAAPPVPEHLVARPRLTVLVDSLLAAHRIVTVFATSGSGKTTAIADAVAAQHRPVAWLTVDDTDRAPGRLLTYLEAAINRALPDTGDVATAAIAAGVPPLEAAGLLIDATAGTGLVLVLDELERIGEQRPACAVIDALIRHAPQDACIVLVSRRELPITADITAFPTAAALGEDELAFTVDEAANALAIRGAREIDAVSAHQETNGWVAGILFEAWRSSEHVAGLGGEADPLHGYLSSQILAQLSDDDRRFLITTSVLDLVTVDHAEALGLHDAAERLDSLRRHRLPVSWLDGSREMRCHGRFREYLLTCLARRGERRLRALRTAHGRVLLDEGFREEAIEELLKAQAFEEARPLVEQAIGAVVERLDYDVAERWLAAVRPASANVASDLAIGELMLAIGQQQYHRGTAVGDRLAASGTRDQLVRSSGRTACMLAWCYWHTGRLGDARSVVEAAGPCPEQPVMRYLLSLCFDDVVEPAAISPALTGEPLDALIVRLHWAHGRLDELRQAPASRWAAAVAQPLRISALLAIGRTDQAAELSSDSSGQPGWLDVMAAVEVLAELGRHEEAWERLRSGRALIPPTGSAVLEMLSGALEARLLLTRGEPQAALVALDQLDRTSHVRTYRFVAELADTWRGRALLDTGRAEEAAHVLRQATRSMTAGDRILELPRAAVYLAEAEWRVGNEDASDAAADLALAIARHQGSTHRLLQALVDMPAVAARAMDAERDRSAAWHDLGRVLVGRGLSLTATPTTAALDLAEFGRLEIRVGDEAVRTRIRKSPELLAYMTAHQRATVRRDELLGALFDGRDDASTRSYLRQAIQQLRAAMPATIDLTVENDRLTVAPLAGLTSESLQFERLCARARTLDGNRRVELLTEALRLYEQGAYLPGVQSRWAAERRDALAREADDARVEIGELLFQSGNYGKAQEIADSAVEDQPYNERAWRLQISLADVVGDEDRALDAFRRCRSALGELGVEPSSTTVALVERLRA